MTIYGIPNCDTMKKAMTWLKDHKIAFEFHDYKKEGISKIKLEAWCKKAGWETILNKKSTSWRALSKTEQDKANNTGAAISIMLANNSIIKRPVLENGKNLLVGFTEKEYLSLL